MASIAACARCAVHGTLTPCYTLVIFLSLLQVAHQGLADDVLQAQVTGWVTERVIPGVDAAYKSTTQQDTISKETSATLNYEVSEPELRLTGAGDSRQVENLCAWLCISCKIFISC